MTTATQRTVAILGSGDMGSAVGGAVFSAALDRGLGASDGVR